MKDTPKKGLRAGSFAVLLVAVGYVVSAMGGGLVWQGMLQLGDSLPLLILAEALYVAVQVGLFTLFVWLAAKREGATLTGYGLTFGPGLVPWLALGLLVGAAAFGLVVLPLYLGEVYRLGPGTGGAAVAVFGFFDFLVVGYVEELLCRGFLQHRLLRLGALKALGLTSLVFAALHLLNDGITLLSFVNIFLAGTFMGAVLYATGSLWAAVGVHITWNWVQGAVLGVPVSGGERYGLFETTASGPDLLTGGSFGAEGSIACTVVLLVGTLLCLWLARRSGRLAEYDAHRAEPTGEAAGNPGEEAAGEKDGE